MIGIPDEILVLNAKDKIQAMKQISLHWIYGIPIGKEKCSVSLHLL